MKNIVPKLKISILSIICITCLYSCKSDDCSVREEAVGTAPVQLDRYGLPSDGMRVENGRIKSGDFFGELMLERGVSNNNLQGVLEASKEVFDIRMIKVGNSYEFYYRADGTDTLSGGKGNGNAPLYFVYEKDAFSHVVFGLDDSIFVRIVQKQIERVKKYASVTVNSSLWNDVSDAGASPLLALKLSDIYAWTIDFFSLQRGDSFKVVYEELSHDGEFIDIGDVWYSEFTHNGKCFTSVRFQDGGKGNIYWNEDGESLRKAFLKAPLSFKRISSKFTYRRKHPVYGVYRPHTGVDYAAPTGTPVMSIGDGVVISKGWGGGGGNTVKIRHNSVYTTAYLHLSRYAKGLKKGDRVKQGQVIGYVGSTGASTGPHLDFRVWKNGTPVDPLKLESPSVEPVSKENMEAFGVTRDALKWEMDSLATMGYVEKMLKVL